MPGNNSFRHLFKKQFLYDIREGFIKVWYTFIPLLAVCFFVGLSFLQKANRYGVLLETPLSPSFQDFLVELLKGVPLISFGENNETLKIPGAFLFSYAFTCWHIARFPFVDLSGLGCQRLLNLKNRKVWWLSKCAWSLILCMLVIGCYLIVALSLGIQTKGIFHTNSADVNWLLSEINLTQFDKSIVFTFCLIPMLSLWALCVLQLTISLFFTPAFAFLLSLVIMGVSIFHCSPYLLGNYLMPLRFEGISSTYSVPIYEGLMINLFVVFLCILVGTQQFQRFDIL